MEGKYSIELFREGGEGSGIERILLRHDSLTAARVLYIAVITTASSLPMSISRMSRADDQQPSCSARMKRARRIAVNIVKLRKALGLSVPWENML
jgi:hypothetical protein